MTNDKINLFEFLASRRGGYSEIVKNMNFKNSRTYKGKIPLERYKKNYNSFYTLINIARKTGKWPGLETLSQIAQALTKILGRNVSVSDLHLDYDKI